MKKTQKKVLGFTGLALVAAMTTYAAILPVPGASAVNNNSTDILQVRVVGSVPDINILDPAGNTTVSTAGQELKINYEHVDKIVVSLIYTDNNGVKWTVEDYKTLNVDYVPGETVVPVDLNKYGYGVFEFKVTGYGADGVTDFDAVQFNYIPTQGKVEDQDDGSVKVELDYDDEQVGRVEIDVYPEGGSDPVWEETVTPPKKEVTIPFDEFAETTGDYEIKISTYDKDGNLLYTTTLTYYYEVVPVPDTGAMLRELNIAKEDYIITGMLIFFVLAVVALGVVVRGRKDRKQK